MSTIENLDSKITELEKNILSLNSVFQDNHIKNISGSFSELGPESLFRSSPREESKLDLIDEGYFNVKEDLSPSGDFIKNIKKNILKPLAIIIGKIDKNSQDVKASDIKNKDLELRILQLESLSRLVKNIPNYEFLTKEFAEKIKVDMVRCGGGKDESFSSDSNFFSSVELHVNFSDTSGTESDTDLPVSEGCKYRSFVKDWCGNKELSELFGKIGGEKILPGRILRSDSEEKSDCPESSSRPSLAAITVGNRERDVFSPRVNNSDSNTFEISAQSSCSGSGTTEKIKGCLTKVFINSCTIFKACCQPKEDTVAGSRSIEL